MDFISYPKITNNASDLKFKDNWVATEKLHGAHFLVCVQEQIVQFGKRKAWLKADDSFFGWQLIKNEIENQAISISKSLNQNVIIYGELIGGHYPHQDVIPVPGLSAIQTGIWYSPQIHWVVFDVLILSSSEEDYFLAYNEVESLAKELSFLIPPFVQRGKLTDLNNISIEFVTRFPKLFNLPTIDNNIAEGIVIKPDLRFKLSERPIIKRKIPKFNDIQFDLSCPYSPGILSTHELLQWSKKLINAPRFASARSKVGAKSNLILEEVILDTIIDLEFAFPETFKKLTLAEQSILAEEIRKLAINIQ